MGQGLFTSRCADLHKRSPVSVFSGHLNSSRCQLLVDYMVIAVGVPTVDLTEFAEVQSDRLCSRFR
jgi:hypothetical protein